jgi:hypothetical protein
MTRLLLALYVLFAIAAGARSSYQIAARLSAAPLAYALSGLAAAVYITAALALKTNRRTLLAAAAAVELAGVLAIGTLSLADGAAFPDDTVWSHYGQGYGFLPLALPVAAFAFLAQSRDRLDLDQQLGPHQRGDLDERAGGRRGCIDELLAGRPHRREP